MKTLYENIKSEFDTKLIKRNITDTSLKNLPKPGLIPGMASAAKRIIKAYENGETWLIVGDYDLDGISATALMVLAWEDAGFIKGVHFDWIVPNRFDDGYGISPNMVDKAIDGNFDIIISVDNGIGAVEAIDYANENGIEVIITDHHTPGEIIPKASIIVDLKYKKGKFPMVDISGCTIAWFFQAQLKIEAQRRSAKRQEAFPIKPINLGDYTDLVGLTVISDVMPLVGMNVGFFKSALRDIKRGKRLAYLLFFNEDKRKTLTETDLSFGMIPAMNAVGRMDDAKYAVDILVSRDTTVVQEKYEYLETVNRRRKKLTLEQLEEIMPEAKKQFNAGRKAIIINGKDLHEGIVGILAGKLSETFNLPSYVFGFNEKKSLWKGSGRTAGEVHLYDLTFTASDALAGFGGHPGAVGGSIKENDFEKFQEIIWESALKIPKETFLDKDVSTFDLTWSEVDYDLVNLINSYRPFGEGFSEPLFKVSGNMIMLKEMGLSGQHWMVSLEDKDGVVQKVQMFFNPNIPNLSGTQQSLEIKLLYSAFGDKLYIQRHGRIINSN